MPLARELLPQTRRQQIGLAESKHSSSEQSNLGVALFFGALLLDRNRERIIFSGASIRQARTRILHQFIARPPQSHTQTCFSCI